MKQEDFDSAVRRYTEELMRLNARRAKQLQSTPRPMPSITPQPIQPELTAPLPRETEPLPSVPEPEPVIPEITPQEQPIQIPQVPPMQIPQVPPIQIPQEPPMQIPQVPPVQIPQVPPVQIPQVPPMQMPQEQPEQTQPEQTQPEQIQPEQAQPEQVPQQPEQILPLPIEEPEEIIEQAEEIALEEKYRGRGILRVTVRTAERTVPIEDATVTVSYDSDSGERLYAIAKTGMSGQIEPLSLPAPVADQFAQKVAFASYTISAEKNGFTKLTAMNVPIFDGQVSEQNFELAPLPLGVDSGSASFISSEPEF